ncbi:polyprotein, putative [Leishmania tarentolae]|uniref:Polyprotein, putative n=1 Tax=Leishmania tarentolae TaxID=5689 RepID=A0A640KFV7_LEITA|nr:polyprotein, putative [Leishmania tarentolae]
MSRDTDQCPSLGDVASQHSPSPPPSSSSSSASYLSPHLHGDDCDSGGHPQRRNRDSSSTLSRTSPPRTRGNAVTSSGKSPRSLSPVYAFSCSAMSSSMRQPSLQRTTQEQTGAGKLSQSAVSRLAPSSDVTTCSNGHPKTYSSVALACGQVLHAPQSASPVLTPPCFAPPVSPPLTTSSQLTNMHAPPPRTHYQYMHSFESRCTLSKRMLRLYGTGTVPVIVEPTESHLRLSPSPSSLNGESKFPADSASGAGAYSRHGQLSSSGRVGAGARASSTASALTSPSAKSTLKCVLPRSKSVAEVILTLRGRLALDSCQSLFLSVGENDVLVPGNSLLGDLYERYRNPDGFLYLGYLLENTFGGDVHPTTGGIAADTVRGRGQR